MRSICVIGLGYVGLPLAVALARRYHVVGYDVSAPRVDGLKVGVDHTGEISSSVLAASSLQVSASAEDVKGADVYIITVPTPVDDAKRPDLSAVIAASRVVGQAISKDGIVVLESTVYPGVTENVVGHEVERTSGLKCGRDFFLGYSPERINPGDRDHTVETIVKVVSGQTPDVASKLAEMYGSLNGGRVFVARDIRTAEAAKVIENAQRDINIAFINEVTLIFNRLGLSIHDVLAAARTKWNFLPFTPGLVGGHCIGVDPYYLADLSQRVGYEPKVILAGRRINDEMGQYVATSVARLLAMRGHGPGARVLVLGLTFKENVPDLRNSKVVDIVRELRGWGHNVDLYDPLADREEARAEYGLDLLPSLTEAHSYSCIVGAVAHQAFSAMTAADLVRLAGPSGVVADVKGMWRAVELPHGIGRWSL